MRVSPILLIIVLLIATYCLTTDRKVKAAQIPYWKVLLAEAASEGCEGMYAVACVIRNRGGDLRGFAGAKRKDLDDFCKRQGQSYILQAKTIERDIFEKNACDTTGGATHFENIKAFGLPYWARDMIITCEIGKHTFFKRR